MRHFHLNDEQTKAAAAAIRGQHERIQQDAAELTEQIRGFDLASGTATIWDLDRARAILPKVDLFSGAAEELGDAGEDEDLLFRRVRRLHHRSMSAVLNADLRTGDRHDLDAHRTMVTTIEDAL